MPAFNRHNYMWSNHSLTGPSLGWGITASSEPKNIRLLKEMERLAAAMPVGSEGDLLTEGLFYGRESGFVYMLSKPYSLGEDGRRNKIVEIFEPMDKEEDPEKYMLRHSWDDQQGEELPVLEEVYRQEKVSELIFKLGLSEIYPVLFHRMTASLLEESASLNIVIPGLSQKDFGAYVNLLMLLYHKFLPKALRKRAGYISYATQELHCSAFYFSDRPCGRNCLSLGDRESLMLSGGEYSELEGYFVKGIADHFLKEDDLFFAYESVVNDYIEKHRSEAGLYGKLQWIYYILERQNDGACLSLSFLREKLPELLFWGGRDEVFGPIADLVLDEIHAAGFQDKEDAASYIDILLKGLSARSMQEILGELHYVMTWLFETDEAYAKAVLKKMEDNNPEVYSLLMLNYAADSYGKDWLLSHTEDLDKIIKTIKGLDVRYLNEPAKDLLFGAGIHILNHRIFEKKVYDSFDELARMLHRKKQWVSILKNLIDQMAEKKDYFTEEELEGGCYIEMMYNKYMRSQKSYVLKSEKERRLKKDEEEITMQDSKTTEERSYELLEEERGHNMSFVSYLMLGLPYGFFTGCAFFLARYALMIGHWKISIGMLGMLLLLFMDYSYTLLEKDTGYALWKSLGLCLFEGLLIVVIVSTKILEPYKIILFLVCGAICLVIRAINLWQIIQEKYNDEDTE